MAKAIEQGLPKRRIEEAAARTQARIDSGRQTVIGVNAFAPTIERDLNVLKVDAAAVRAMQIEKLKRLRAERDEAATQTALEALTERRARQGQPAATVGRGGPGQGDGRRNLARDGESLRPPCRGDPRHFRRLSRRVGAGGGSQPARDRNDPRLRRKRGPSAAHTGRQDGSGRPRPRPEDHRLGLRRSRL